MTPFAVNWMHPIGCIVTRSLCTADVKKPVKIWYCRTTGTNCTKTIVSSVKALCQCIKTIVSCVKAAYLCTKTIVKSVVVILIDCILFYVSLANIFMRVETSSLPMKTAKSRYLLAAYGTWAGWNFYQATPAVTRGLGFLRSHTKDHAHLVASYVLHGVLSTYSNLSLQDKPPIGLLSSLPWLI